jgi:hypothetical protein
MPSLVQLCSEFIMIVTSLQLFLWWKGGVGRSSTPLAHVPEPIFCVVEGRGGEEWYSSRTRTGAY